MTVGRETRTEHVDVLPARMVEAAVSCGEGSGGSGMVAKGGRSGFGAREGAEPREIGGVYQPERMSRQPPSISSCRWMWSRRVWKAGSEPRSISAARRYSRSASSQAPRWAATSPLNVSAQDMYARS